MESVASRHVFVVLWVLLRDGRVLSMLSVRLGHRWRGRVWRTTPLPIRRWAHVQDQTSAIHNIRMAEPRLVPWLSIERCRLDIQVLFRVIPGDDDKALAVPCMDGHLIKDRAAKDVVRTGWIDGIEPHCAHH